jgi:putative ABC transport system permease protein
MLLRALILRPVVQRPARFFATVLGVAAGIAAVVATVAASRAAIASLREGITEIAGRTRLEITAPGGLPEDALARLRPLTGDAVVLPVIEEVALLPKLGDAVRVLGLDLILDASARDLLPSVRLADEETRIERLLTGRGALVSRALATALVVQPGMDFELSARAQCEPLVLAGTFVPPHLASAWDRVVIVDVALAQDLFGRHGRLDRIELVPRAGVTLDELHARAAPLLPAGAAIAPPQARAEETSRMVRALEFNLTALSGISLIVGLVLVTTTLATAVVQRRTVFAIARALGASRAQVGLALLVEAAAIGMLGGALGVLGGIFGARAALASVRATVAAVIRDVPATAIQLPPWLAAFGLALGIVLSLLAAALPLLEAWRTPPVQDLRHEHPEALARASRRRALALAGALCGVATLASRMPPLHDLPVAALLGSLALFAATLAVAAPLLDVLGRVVARPLVRTAVGTPLRLALAALAAGRRRASWAAGAVGLAVALAVAIATLVHSFRVTVVDWTNEVMHADVWIRPLAATTGVQIGRLDPEIVRVAERLFGHDAVDPFHTAPALMRGEKATLGGGEFAVVARHGGVQFRDGRDSRAVFAAALAGRRATINEPFARRFGVHEGDEIRLTVAGGELVRRVEGVFYDYSRQHGMAVVDRKDFLAVCPDDGPQELALFLPPTVSAAAARERLLHALGGRYLVEVLLNRELRREVVAIFDRTFAITTALQAVAITVAVLAVLTVLFALLDERRRDLATLRALGAARAQVGGLIAAEAALLGLTGALSGVAAGVVVGAVLVKVVNLQSFGWTLRLLVPWRTLAVSAALVTLACALAGVAPALVAARRHPGEELRDEG